MAMSEAALSVAPASCQRRRVTILGATGSVGRSTADLVARNADRYVVEALTAHRDVQNLKVDVSSLKPGFYLVKFVSGDDYRTTVFKELLVQ